MQADIEDNLLRQIDPNQAYLWKWNDSKGKSGGILSGVRVEVLDVASFKEEKYMLQLNLWDKERKNKMELLKYLWIPT